MQQIQLSIPEPCHENWQQMTPTEQGRFCNACAKQVIDFSTMSDTQVLNYFINKKEEKVCGRAYPDQLERMITVPKEPKKRLFWKLNYISMFFLLFSKTNNAKAQGGVKVDTISRLDIVPEILGKMQAINYTSRISGTVKDEKEMPIAGATVRIKAGNTATATDSKGNYKINAATNDVLVVTYVGYDAVEIDLRKAKTFDVTLQPRMLGEVVTVGAIVSVDVDNIMPADPKHIALLEIRDNATMQPVKADIIIKKNGYNDGDAVTTDKKGLYKLKKIKEYETYNIKVIATGYLDQELQIKGTEFDQRKITKKIFLEKAPEVNDYIKMDSVMVKSDPIRTIKCTTTTGAISTVMGGMMSGMTIYRSWTDSVRSVITKISGDLKVYPSPVQKGNAITVELKLKQAGDYVIQVITTAGLVVTQKQVTTSSKAYSGSIETNMNWSSGMYFIRVLDKQNRLVSTTKFLVN